MNRRIRILAACLLVSLLFAAWTWLRPYQWSPDPAARYRISHASVRHDHGFYWLELQLRQSGQESHDLRKPVALLLQDGREMEPADIDLEGTAERPIDALGLRFWLEAKDFAGPLRLKLNEGTLVVREGSGVPLVGADARFWRHSDW